MKIVQFVLIITLGLLLLFVSAHVCMAEITNFGGVTSSAKSKPSDYNTGLTLEEAVKTGKPVVIMFYADWCGACKQVAPGFALVRKGMSNSAEFVMVNVDKNKKFTGDYGVTSYPSLFLLKPHAKAKRIPYEKVYPSDDLRNYLQTNI